MNLADHPDESFATVNDDEARALLVKEGLLYKLEQESPGDRLLPNQTRWMEIFDHPTHWIIAIRFLGFSRPEENGYLVRCLSKRKVSREQFELQAKAEKHQQFTQGTTQQDDDLPPTGNN